MPADEWKQRRFAALTRFVDAATGQLQSDPSGKGRFFTDEDQFGWYLFLASAKLDHPMVYDFTFGSRVIPVFKAIGRSLDLLKDVDGVSERVQRLVGAERRQPNGGLFELLVAAAYRREGADVKLLPERKNQKTHDMDVTIQGTTWAIECKRLEGGEYTEKERAFARRLWIPVADELMKQGMSVLATVDFRRELQTIPPNYLAKHVRRWITRGGRPHGWEDEHSTGTIKVLDLGPLQKLLKTDDVASMGSKMQLLLTGRYRRSAKVIQQLHAKPADNPLFVSGCDQAVVLDWSSTAPTAIDAKARDVVKRLSDGSQQLPADRPGVVHIAFEAVDGDDVEKVRYEKILKSIESFDPQGKPLEFVYVHWFAPESPPDAGEAFDETVHYSGRGLAHQRPLKGAFVVNPEETVARAGRHWDTT